MGDKASPPTDRVIAIVELLARQRGGGLRLIDLAQKLDLSQSTVHAIVTTLCERGWASRDSIDKTLTLGPAFAVMAASCDLARPRAHATRIAAIELAQELGYAASVTERSAKHLTLNFFGRTHVDVAAAPSGERIRFCAPFGPAFAAWDDEPERQSWMAMGARSTPELAKRLSEYLDATRERGYSVEHMVPTLARTARLLEPLGNDQWSTRVRNVIDDALVEIAAEGFVPDGANDSTEVTAISAPVFDRHGRAVLNIGIHPFAPLALSEIEAIGRRLVQASAAISSGAEHGEGNPF